MAMARLVDGALVKLCARCNVDKPASAFNKSKSKSDGLQYQCRECAAIAHQQRKLSPEAIRAHNLKYRFGLTVEQYDAMAEAQGHQCAICGAHEPQHKRMAIDHDHSCCPGKKTCGQCVRGLLCFECNTGLGKFKDDIDLLEAAVAYLKEYQ